MKHDYIHKISITGIQSVTLWAFDCAVGVCQCHSWVGLIYAYVTVVGFMQLRGILGVCLRFSLHFP